MRTIHQCGSHLLTLINDILDLSKIEACKLELAPTPRHLPSLLQSVVEMFQIRAEQKGIEFIYQPSSRLPTGVAVDEKRLRQVLLNLLGNAIKFTDRGSVTLRVDVLSLCDTQVALFFEVLDTGVGIAEANLAKLFQAFEQVGDRQKQAEGTGLGLTISQCIVQLMGSRIQVKSQIGAGSEFFFSVELPLVEDWRQPQGIMEGGDCITGYVGERRKILIADDRWENRAVLTNLLEPLGLTTIEAENGREGLEKLRSLHPDLAIADLVMPEMDGFEFLQHIRSDEDLKQTKVIVSSASVSPDDRQMSLDRGGDDFLPKPVDAKLLFELLATHLNLEWVWEPQKDNSEPLETLASEVVLPPSPTLKTLLELVRQADLNDLQKQIEQLVEMDEAYAPFATSILQFAREFQIEAIEKLLLRYLAADSTPRELC